MSKRRSLDYLLDARVFRALCAKKLSPGGRIVKQVSNIESGAKGVSLRRDADLHVAPLAISRATIRGQICCVGRDRQF